MREDLNLETREREGGLVFVTGATGPVGTELTRLLSASGRPARALCRKEGQAEQLRRMGLEPVLGDFDNPRSLEEAMRGCETVFLLSPGAQRQAVREKEAIDAAGGAGVRRIVRVSAADSNLGAPVPWARTHAHAHAKIDHLRESRLAWTTLKPTAFMQNFLSMTPPISKGILPHISREGRGGRLARARPHPAVSKRGRRGPRGGRHRRGRPAHREGPALLRELRARL